jgi:D-alanyl-D-alanine carboxypeptidase
MRYSKWSVRLVAAVVVPLLTAVVAAPAVAGDVSGDRLPRHVLQGLLDHLVAPDIPGAMGLARDGDQTWRGASGLADIATGRPMDPADRYKVGSVTKTFTATVVLQLVGEGKLGLQDSVQRWLPGLVPNGKNIKIRHLLQHTSGLYDYLADPRVADPYLVNGDLDFVWRPRQLIAIAVEHPPLFAPGTSWSYSNTGFVLLGLIVEAATGTTMQHQLEARIFRPLARVSGFR